MVWLPSSCCSSSYFGGDYGGTIGFLFTASSFAIICFFSILLCWNFNICSSYFESSSLSEELGALSSEESMFYFTF